MDKKPFLRLEAGKTRDFVKKVKMKMREIFTNFMIFIAKLTFESSVPQPLTAASETLGHVKK